MVLVSVIITQFELFLTYKTHKYLSNFDQHTISLSLRYHENITSSGRVCIIFVNPEDAGDK